MARKAGALALVGAVLLSAAAAAVPVRPAVEQAKIDYLLGELQASPATFIRNGREYSGKRAAAHVARKLKFAGKRVQTARDFIIGVASRSLDSGKPYEVRWNDGKRQPLGEWLFELLARYERERLPKATPSPPPKTGQAVGTHFSDLLRADS